MVLCPTNSNQAGMCYLALEYGANPFAVYLPSDKQQGRAMPAWMGGKEEVIEAAINRELDYTVK